MPKSSAFIRIKTDVIKIVSALPQGRVTTFRSIGEHLDVMPRHVAYILTMLSDDEKSTIPWFRVVSDDGKLRAPKFGSSGQSQESLLNDDGVLCTDKGISTFAQSFTDARQLKSGVKKQKRPSNLVRASNTRKLVLATETKAKDKTG